MTASVQAKPPRLPRLAVGKPAAPVKDTPASRTRKQIDALSAFWCRLSAYPPRQPGAGRRTLRLLETRLSKLSAQTRRVAVALLGTPAPRPHARPGISTPGEPAQPLPPWPPGTWVHRQSRATISRDSHPPARARAAPGAITRQAPARSGSSRTGEGCPACDPGGVPFRQLVRIPSGIPADTGIPAPRQTPGSGRSRPSGGLPD